MDRHMILTLGRSGSNTLRDMLNQNPEVLNFGEVLGPWTDMRRLQKRLPLIPKDNVAYLDFILTSRHSAARASRTTSPPGPPSR